MKQGRLNIGILGGSIEGIAIAQALQQAGHQVVAISRSATQSEDVLNALLPFAKKGLDSLVIEQSELILLAVAPDEIESIVSSNIESFKAGQIAVHLAAEFDHEVLSSLSEKGVITLSLHPAMRFTGTSLDINRIKESYFAVSAPAVALPIAQALVFEMGAEPVVVLGPERKLYAEAIAVAGNFSAMIVNQAIGLLEQAGVENPALVIAPVIESAVDQALSKGHREINPEDLIGDS